jgi:hypothetical protein
LSIECFVGGPRDLLRHREVFLASHAQMMRAFFAATAMIARW